MEIKAYAKINIILNILGKRTDGYHEIETIFQTIDLYDLVRVNVTYGESSLVMTDENGEEIFDVKKEDNIAYKALELIKDCYGIKEKFSVEIEKHIPMPGGLGGGSSDAAAVLTAISRLKNITVDEKLYALSAQLGSDVPFLLASQNGHPAAIGRGRGEILEFIKPLDARLCLKKGKIALANKTKEVYKALKPEDYLVKYDVTAFLKAEETDEKIKYIGNHLQAPLERLTGERSDWTLCGAGPTYFRFDKDGEYRTIVL